MTLVRYKDQCELAFLSWTSTAPFSAHPNDKERFYRFAKSVAVYRSKKWLDEEYFSSRIKGKLGYTDERSTEKYWSKLDELVRFHKTGPVPTVAVINDDKYGIAQSGVHNGEVYKIPISREGYMNGGLSRSEVRRLISQDKPDLF